MTDPYSRLTARFTQFAQLPRAQRLLGLDGFLAENAELIRVAARRLTDRFRTKTGATLNPGDEPFSALMLESCKLLSGPPNLLPPDRVNFGLVMHRAMQRLTDDLRSEQPVGTRNFARVAAELRRSEDRFRALHGHEPDDRELSVFHNDRMSTCRSDPGRSGMLLDPAKVALVRSGATQDVPGEPTYSIESDIAVLDAMHRVLADCSRRGEKLGKAADLILTAGVHGRRLSIAELSRRLGVSPHVGRRLALDVRAQLLTQLNA